jgi:CheY-like chemotaxis protein
MQEKNNQRLLASIIKIARDAIKTNRAKTELISNLSYELRSALTSIMGLAQLLTMECLLPAQQQSIADILNVGESIIPLMNQLLNFSEYEAQQMLPDPFPFNLKNLFEKVVKQLVFQAKAKGLQFFLDYPDHLPRYVVGNPDLIHQLMIHLSSYALKNTEQGHVMIKLDYIQNKQDEFDEFIVKIKDAGQGMQEKELKQLRTCLRYANSPAIRNYRNIDLGMAITLAYVKLLKARLGVESKATQGSSFVCRLLLKRATKRPEKAVQQQTLACLPTQLRILLIEDNIIIQKIYKTMLEKIKGCCVDSAVNAQMALDYYMRFPYDLIFMDICLPDSNGMEITQIIRRQETKKEHIPIIAITANANASDKEKFLKSGIDEVLTKPNNLEEIIFLLERWTHSQCLQSQNA